MKTEQNKTLEALQIAIQMEIDGKKYYQEASQSSGNRIGTDLFQSLAAEEDIHRRKFEEIFHTIQSKKAWPDIDFQPDQGKGPRTIFAQATEAMDSDIKVLDIELDAVKTAMNMENKSYDYYQTQRTKATYDAEKEYYQALATQEKAHHRVLYDYFEYLKDPAAWFVQQEHPSLDGG